MAILIAGCSSTPPGSAEASATASAATACKPGGTLVMARDIEPESLNPMQGSNNGSIFTQMQLFERLVEQSTTSKDPVPGAAESWDIAPDGLSYTFHLRPNKFSNGDPVTAEDVKFSLDRFKDPAKDPNYSFLAGNIKDVVVVDPSTVRMEMSAVDASILSTLTLMATSIVPEKVVTALGEDGFGASPIGSGPFMVKQWTRGQNLEVVRNPNYWRQGQPYLDGVNFQFVKDDNARILKAQSGEAQVVQAIPISQAGTIKNIAGYSLYKEPLYAQDDAWLNHSWDNNGSKPLGDKLVRQALNYATPKDDLNRVVFGGLAMIMNTGTSPTRFWDASIPPYPYDLNKAKQLMAQSTVPGGFTMPMIIPTGDTVAQQTAELLKSEWVKIGVNLDIQPLDSAVRSKKIHSLDYASGLNTAADVTSDTPDDSELASIMYDWNDTWKSFFTDYKSADAVKLVHEAVATVDPAKRREIYSQLQKLTLDDAVSVPLVSVPSLTAVSDTVQGFKTLPSGWWTLQDVCLTP